MSRRTVVPRLHLSLRLPRQGASGAIVALFVLVTAAPAPTRCEAASLSVGGFVATAETPAGLAGAQVSLYRLEEPFEEGTRLLAAGEPEPLASVISDEAGLFHLRAPDPGGFTVVVRAKGYLPARVVLAPLVEDVELPPLTLEPLVELTVTVRDVDGRPVPVAGVEAETAQGSDLPYLEPQSRWKAAPRRARTDANGVATVPRTPGERLVLRVVAPGFDDQTLDATDVLEVRLQGIAEWARRLEARGPDGKTMAEVLVRPTGSRLPLGRTDEEGRIAVGVPAGGRGIELLGPGGLAASRRLEPPTKAETASDRPLIVALEPPRELRVAVTDASTGAPLQRALVGYEQRLPRRRTSKGIVFTGEIGSTLAETGSAGEALLPISALLSGTELLLHVAAPGYITGSFETAGSGETPVALARAAAAEGVVVDEAGTPLAGIEVEAELASTAGGISRATMAARTSRGRSADDGAVHLTGLLPGAGYTVTARAPGFAPANASLDGLEPFATHTGLRLVLAGGRRVTGAVLSEEEEPVAGARVFLLEPVRAGESRMSRRGQTPLETTSAEDGTFALDHIAPGTWDLTVEAAGFAVAVVRGLEIPAAGGELDLGTLHLAPGATIEGIVTDSAERPLEGASILIMVDSGLARPSGSIQGEMMTTRGRSVLQDLGIATDERGRFAVGGLQQGEKLTLVVSLAGYLSRQIPGVVAPLEAPLEVVLERGASVSGRVEGEGRRPLEGARVRAESTDERRGLTWSRQYLEPVRTGEDGRFRIAGIPAGTWTVVAQAEAYAPGRREGIRLEAGQEIEDLVVALDRGAAVEGRVASAEGEAMAGVRVYFRAGAQPAAETVSDAEGSFRLEGVPLGRGTVVASTQDLATVGQEIEVEPAGTWVELRFPGLELSGRVVDESGNGIAGAEIMVFSQMPSNDGRTMRRSRSDADGVFSVDRLGPGEYRLSAQKSGFPSVWREAPIVLADGPITDLEIVLHRGVTLTGRIVGLSVDELAQVAIRAVGRGEGSTGMGEGQTDYEGRFAIADLAPGTYAVTATLPNEGREATAQVELGESGGTVEIEFGEGFTLSGRVTRNGEPFSGAHLNLSSLDSGPSPLGPRLAFTDHQGSFVFTDLARGSYHVSVENLHDETVDLLDDRELLIEIATAGVRGRVVDAETGVPLPGAAVALRPMSDPASPSDILYRGTRQRDGVTDSDGRFSFDDVPEGTYYLTASLEGYGAVEQSLPVRGGAELAGLELALTPAAESLELAVRGPLGTPDRITVGVLAGTGQLTTVGTYSVDRSGTVTVPIVPAGDWLLLISASATATMEVDVRVPGPVVPVTLPAGRLLTVRAPAFEEARATLTLLAPSGRPFRQIFFGELVDHFPLDGGRSQVSGLPPGQWTLLIESDDGRMLSGSASTEEGVTEVVLE